MSDQTLFSEDKTGAKFGRFIFLLAFCLFLFFQVRITLVPMLERQVQVEADDAYNLILKAEQINNSCFFQDCPALNDLRQELYSPDSDPDVSSIRRRVYQRVFLVYNPLHSVTLVLLNRSGLEYEVAFNLVAIIGKLIISFGIAYWLYAILGRKTTTISLLLLAPVVFGGQGLSSVWPNSISLGFSLIIWGLILRKSEFAPPFLVPVMIITILFHPIGKIYSGIALALYLMKASRPISKRDIKLLSLASVILISSFLIPLFISRPEMEFSATFFFPGWDYFNTLLNSSELPSKVFHFWLSAFPNNIIASALLIIGAVSLLRNRNRNFLYVVMLIFALLILGWLYILPDIGSILLGRVVIPTEIFITGILGQALYIMGSFAHSIIIRPKAILNGKPPNIKYRIWQVAAVGLISAIVFLILHQYYSHHIRHYKLTQNEMIVDQDIYFNSEQPNLIGEAKQGISEVSILYLRETPLYLYLSNGALDHGALFLPAVGSTSEDQNAFKKNLENISYLVERNPIFPFQEIREIGILLENNSTLSLEGTSGQSYSSLEVLVTNNGGEATLSVDWTDGSRAVNTRRIIEADSSNWISFEQSALSADKIIFAVGNNQEMLIQGIRFNSTSKTFWPWEEGIIRTLDQTGADPRILEISEDALTGGLDLEIEVVDDKGFTVLAKVLE